MTFKPIAEIFLYELIDILPNLLLALIPFRNSLRLSKIKTGFFVLLLYLFVVISRISALNNLYAAVFFSVAWIAVYLSFYFLLIRIQITKLLFMLLTILNYCSFVVIVFSHLAYYRIPGISNEPYSFAAALVLFLVYLVSYPYIFRFIDRKIRPLFEEAALDIYWRFLWFVPATFCFSYYYYIFANGGIIAFSSSINNVIFAVIFTLGALFVTFILAKLMEECNSVNMLKEENAQLNLQFLQYETLKTRMEEARRAKHDLRQNLTVIQSYTKDENYDGLLNYIGNYINSLPADSPIVYCNNYALNALLVYYENLAREHSILFEAHIDYPDNSGISDNDAVVLFGNLLENATEACLRDNNSQPYISFRIKTMHKVMVVALDNSYSGDIYKHGSSFLSAKTMRPGIGISSIQKITDKYNGFLKFDYNEHEFHASIMLTTNII